MPLDPLLQMDALINFAKFLASLWVVVGSVWLLYRGVLYVRAAMTEAGLPKDEKRFSSPLAWIITLGEVAFIGAVILYLWQGFDVTHR